MRAEEEAILKTSNPGWPAPRPEIDILIIDELGKDIGGAAMDINRGVQGQYNR